MQLIKFEIADRDDLLKPIVLKQLFLRFVSISLF